MFSFYMSSYNTIKLLPKCDFTINCLICKRKIKLDGTENLFIVTLGNFINGIFCGSKREYFHVICGIEDKIK